MSIRQIACASTLALMSSLIGFTAIVPAVQAGTPFSDIHTKDSTSSQTLRQGLPGRRLGGGTRSDRIFMEDYVYLTALVTADNLSSTTAKHPSFMFYVPEMVQSQTAEFVLRDANDELIYETSLQLNSSGGLVNIDTSTAGIEALNINENYTWYFSIVPNLTDRANDVVVYGNVQRVEHNSIAQSANHELSLDQASPEELLMHAQRLRQDTALWHDAANIVGTLHQADPGNELIAAEWNALLEAAGLAAVM